MQILKTPPDNFYGNVLPCFVIQGSYDLTKTSFPNHFQDLVPERRQRIKHFSIF